MLRPITGRTFHPIDLSTALRSNGKSKNICLEMAVWAALGQRCYFVPQQGLWLYYNTGIIWVHTVGTGSPWSRGPGQSNPFVYSSLIPWRPSTLFTGIAFSHFYDRMTNVASRNLLSREIVALSFNVLSTKLIWIIPNFTSRQRPQGI